MPSRSRPTTAESAVRVPLFVSDHKRLEPLSEMPLENGFPDALSEVTKLPPELTVRLVLFPVKLSQPVSVAGLAMVSVLLLTLIVQPSVVDVMTVPPVVVHCWANAPGSTASSDAPQSSS